MLFISVLEQHFLFWFWSFKISVSRKYIAVHRELLTGHNWKSIPCIEFFVSHSLHLFSPLYFPLFSSLSSSFPLFIFLFSPLYFRLFSSFPLLFPPFPSSFSLFFSPLYFPLFSSLFFSFPLFISSFDASFSQFFKSSSFQTFLPDLSFPLSPLVTSWLLTNKRYKRNKVNNDD